MSEEVNEGLLAEGFLDAVIVDRLWLRGAWFWLGRGVPAHAVDA